MSTATCPTTTCGCNAPTDPGCLFDSTDRSCAEYVCSAGGAVVSTDPATCFTGTSPPTLDQLKSIWETNNCPQVYSGVLFDLPIPGQKDSLKYNVAKLPQVQADAYNLLTTYTQTYGKQFTDRVTSAQYDVLQEQLIAMCANPQIPGICDLFLGGTNGYCSGFTRDQITSDRSLNMMCGCYAGENPYSSQPAPCDPICHLTTTVQKADCCGIIQTCNNTVCIIDDVTISLVGGSTSGTPAFTQICPSCNDPANPCTCIISGTSITRTLDQSGVGPLYTQYCGTDATCLIDTPTGNQITTCPAPSSFTLNNTNYTFVFVFIIIVAIVLIFAGLIMLATKHRITETYTREPVAPVGVNTGPLQQGQAQYSFMQ